MEQLNLYPQKFKNRGPVILFSLLSWFLLFPFSLYCRIEGGAMDFTSVSNVLSLLITPAPCLLIYLYTFAIYRKRRSITLILFAFILTAITPIYTIFTQYGVYSFLNVQTVISFLARTLFVVALILAGVFLYIRSSNRVFIILAPVLGILISLNFYVYYVAFIYTYGGSFSALLNNHGFYMNQLAQLFEVLGQLLLYVALLILGLGLTGKPAPAPALDPEQALNLLYERRCREEISAEEYQAQRAEIIRNL